MRVSKKSALLEFHSKAALSAFGCFRSQALTLAGPGRVAVILREEEE